MNALPGLFTDANLQIFELLVDESLSIRDLAAEVGCSPAKASQAVSKFLEKGLVKAKSKKNRKIISLNRKNPLTSQAVSLLFIDKIVESKTFKEMKKKARAIGVYGSVAEGTVDARSDVDLWMLVDKSVSLSVTGRMQLKLGKELNREVNIKPFTKKSLARLKERDKIFFNELRYKSKILYGEISWEG